MQKFYPFKYLLAVITAALLIASCGTTQGTTGETTPNIHGTVTVWSYLTLPEVAVIKNLANRWAAKTGNQVNVIPGTNLNFQQFATAAHTGKGPDMVFGLPNDNLGTFYAAHLLAPVPAGVIDPSEYTQAAVEATEFGGKMYAVPLDVETYALFYNKQLFPTPPKTFTQLIQRAKQIDKMSGYYGFQYDINNFYYSYAFIAGFGGYVFKQSHGHIYPDQLGLDTPGAIKGLAFIRQFVTLGLMPSDITGNIADANFAHGKLGAIIDGPWDISTYQKADVPFGIEPLPLLPNGKHPESFLGTQTAFVSATVSKTQQKLAWSLMQYLLNHAVIPLLKAGNRIPAQKPAQAQAIKLDPYLKAFIEQSQWAQPMPSVPQMQAVWTPGADTLVEVTKGVETPSQAAYNMVREIKAGIAELK